MTCASSAEEEELPPYEVLLTSSARREYRAIASRHDLAAVNGVLELLGTVPSIGRVYDPLYDAARPRFELRVAYAGSYGIYFEIVEERREVWIHTIEDQRRDPLKRFRSLGDA